MTFFDEGTTLPPPFNLVPSPKTAFDLGVWVVRRITGEKRARCSLRVRDEMFCFSVLYIGVQCLWRYVLKMHAWMYASCRKREYTYFV